MSRYYSMSHNSKMVQDRAILTMTNQQKVERRHCQWPWTTPIEDFKVTPLFNPEYLRNGTRYRHNFNGIVIGTTTQQCHIKWPWVTLSDLAKYSMTRSVARSLCDSWASYNLFEGHGWWMEASEVGLRLNFCFALTQLAYLIFETPAVTGTGKMRNAVCGMRKIANV